MKYVIVVAGLGIFSLLMANETIKSATDVLNNPNLYKGMGLPTHSQYALLSSGFLICGIVCIVVAIGLFVSIEKQSQNQAR